MGRRHRRPSRRGLATVVASHELAEVLVIGNGIRAGRKKHLPTHPALRTAHKAAPPIRPPARPTADTLTIVPAPKMLLPLSAAPAKTAEAKAGGGCCEGCSS